MHPIDFTNDKTIFICDYDNGSKFYAYPSTTKPEDRFVIQWAIFNNVTHSVDGVPVKSVLARYLIDREEKTVVLKREAFYKSADGQGVAIRDTEMTSEKMLPDKDSALGMLVAFVCDPVGFETARNDADVVAAAEDIRRLDAEAFASAEMPMYRGMMDDTPQWFKNRSGSESITDFLAAADKEMEENIRKDIAHAKNTVARISDLHSASTPSPSLLKFILRKLF